MAVRLRYRAAACGLLAACSLSAYPTRAMAQEPSGPEEQTDLADTPAPTAPLSAGARLSSGQRLTAPPLSGSERLAPPLSSSDIGQSGRIDDGLRLDVDALRRSAPTPSLPDDTTNPGLSRRENFRDTPALRTGDAGSDTAQPHAPRRAAEPDAPSSNLFQSIGPVRSPTLDEIGNRRLSDAYASLRRLAPGIRSNDPFAPVGTRIGSFMGYLTLDQSLGASDNLTASRDGVSGFFSQSTLTGRLVSDWSRHEAELNVAATYRRNMSGPVKDEPQVDADGRVRIDISRDMTAVLRGAVSFSREDDLTVGAVQDAAARADRLRYSMSAELQNRFGRFDTVTTLQAVRDDLSDRAQRTNSLDDSFTTYTAGLKATLDERAPLHPFVAASIGRRAFDKTSFGGVSRDSAIPALRGGVGFSRGEKVSGEIALGYAWNIPDDNSLPTIGSPTLDALLAWSPRRGTDVTLRGTTSFEPETTSLDTATLYQLSLGLTHRATARLEFNTTLIAGLRERRTVANEYVYSGEAGFTYWLNQHLALTGLYRYDRFEAALPFNNYSANTVRVGVRLQN
ncbi:outer membrane beta-barrel protein [Aureimonas ureilytica]|nr:outer membrane beta-barrel protein [Aureimonas ureilytica]